MAPWVDVSILDTETCSVIREMGLEYVKKEGRVGVDVPKEKLEEFKNTVKTRKNANNSVTAQIGALNFPNGHN